MIATRVDYLAVIADLERQRDALNAAIEALRQACPAASAAEVPAASQAETHLERVEHTPKTSPLGSHQSGTYRPERDQQILTALAAGSPTPMTATEIARAIHGEQVGKSVVSNVWTAIRRLVRDGQVVTPDGKRYRLAVAASAPEPALDATTSIEATPSVVEPATPSEPVAIKTASADGVALRQPSPPKKQAVPKGDDPWWVKTKPGEMTATAEQELDRMSKSREARQVSGSIGV